MEWNNLSRDQMVAQLGLNRNYQGADLLVPALGIFGTGLLIGAGLGLLLAPKSGNELRGDIRRGAGELRHRTTHMIQDTSDNLRARIGKGDAPGTEEQEENPYSDEVAPA